MMQAMSGRPSDPGRSVYQSPITSLSAPRGDLSGKKILFCSLRRTPVSVRRRHAFKASLDRLAGLGRNSGVFRRRLRYRADLARRQSHGLADPVREARDRSQDDLSETFLKQLALASKVSGCRFPAAMFDRTALFRRVQSLLARATGSRCRP